MKDWRPRPESNRRTRICNPLRHHSATGPALVALEANIQQRRLVDRQPDIAFSPAWCCRQALLFIDTSARRQAGLSRHTGTPQWNAAASLTSVVRYIASITQRLPLRRRGPCPIPLRWLSGNGNKRHQGRAQALGRAHGLRNRAPDHDRHTGPPE